MKPEKAHELGVKPEEVRIECDSSRYAGQWVAFVQEGERQRVLTQDASIYKLTRWKAQLERLTHERN